MRVAIGSDHAGFQDPEPHFKPALVEFLKSLGHEVVDCGPFDGMSVDYPDYAEKVCKEILEGRADLGVLMCGSGLGICMAANRFKGIRAADCVTQEMASLAREHNHANVLCLGQRLLDWDECTRITETFLTTPCSDHPRHVRRINKMG